VSNEQESNLNNIVKLIITMSLGPNKKYRFINL